MILGQLHTDVLGSLDAVLFSSLHPYSQWLFDSIDHYPLVGILISLMLIDIATGMLAAAINKRLSSKVSWKGMCRKAVIVLIVGFGVILENPSLGHQFPVSKLISLFYIATEALSIVENASASGVPFPAKVKEMLVSIKHADKSPHPINISIDSDAIKELSESGIIKSVKSDELTPNPKHPPKSYTDSIHE